MHPEAALKLPLSLFQESAIQVIQDPMDQSASSILCEGSGLISCIIELQDSTSKDIALSAEIDILREIDDMIICLLCCLGKHS